MTNDEVEKELGKWNESMQSIINGMLEAGQLQPEDLGLCGNISNLCDKFRNEYAHSDSPNVWIIAALMAAHYSVDEMSGCAASELVDGKTLARNIQDLSSYIALDTSAAMCVINDCSGKYGRT